MTVSTRTAARPATTAPESVPSRWTGADELFFGLVAEIFGTGFLWGATTLLGSYDPEPDTA
jgi:hypothetical protein